MGNSGKQRIRPQEKVKNRGPCSSDHNTEILEITFFSPFFLMPFILI
jgi:hypothetical protein